MRRTILVGALVCMTACAANVEPVPITHKVEGKVIAKDGKAFSGGGAIEFRSDLHPGTTSIGEIAPDGTFVLSTVTANHKRAGAQEGPHSVTVIPASPDHTIPPIPLSKKYVIDAGNNKITVEIED